MWESIESIAFAKAENLAAVENRPGLYKLINRAEPDKFYIGNAFSNLHDYLNTNWFHFVSKEPTNDLQKEIKKLKAAGENPEEYYEIEVCYQNEDAERLDLILAKRLLISELKPYYNYKGKPSKEKEAPEPKVITLTNDYVQELKSKMADITAFLEKNHPEKSELFDLLILALQAPNASSINSLVKSVGRDFMRSENETFVFKEGNRALGTSKKYVSWVMANGSTLLGMGTESFLRRVRDIMNSRNDIVLGNSESLRSDFNAFIDNLKSLRKSIYLSEFSYKADGLNIKNANDFSILDEKPWVITQVEDRSGAIHGFILENAPGRQTLNKKPGIVVK